MPCLALALCGLLIWQAAGTAKVAASPAAGIAAASSYEIRILTGLKEGTYIDRLGRTWQSDSFFEGGSVFEAAGQRIAGTRDPRLYRGRREGAFSYDIPLPSGVYELRLHFAETLYGENNIAGGGETSRIFNVFANGVQILRAFDVINEVGANTADTRAFKDISPAADGKLHLKFDPETSLAILSGIEITRGIPGKLAPIRMVSREHPYTDKQGRTWEADSYSWGGQLAVRTEPVLNIDDPELLRGERYGNLTYAIPVPPGRYTVKLYFAEVWFGPGNFAGGGTGSRIFDILCNGVAVTPQLRHLQRSGRKRPGDRRAPSRRGAGSLWQDPHFASSHAQLRLVERSRSDRRIEVMPASCTERRLHSLRWPGRAEFHEAECR